MEVQEHLRFHDRSLTGNYGKDGAGTCHQQYFIIVPGKSLCIGTHSVTCCCPMQARVVMVALLALSCSADAHRLGAIALSLPARVRGAGGSLAPAKHHRALLSRAQTLLSRQLAWPAPWARLPPGLHGLGSTALVGRRAPVQHVHEGSRSSAAAQLPVTVPAQHSRLSGDAGSGPTDADRRRAARDILIIMAGVALPDPALVRGLLPITIGARWVTEGWKALIRPVSDQTQ